MSIRDLVPVNPLDFHPDLVEHPRPDDPRIRFKFRARIAGMKYWICFYCGFHNGHRVIAESFVLRCNNEHCRRFIGIGSVGYIIPDGKRSAPPDIVIPRGLMDSYPEGDIARWKTGQPINKVAILAWPQPADVLG